MSERTPNGRFATGNPGGPGRPRRAVEREYLAALSDLLPLPKWKKICRRAIDDAMKGNPAAREWVSRYIGLDKLNLTELAATELHGLSADEEVKAAARSDKMLRKRMGLN